MKKIIIEGSGEPLIRSAIVEDGRLAELIIDDKNKASLVGRIYAGIVKDILPSQFAFVDIGLERNGFLHFSDKREKGVTLKRGQHLLLQVIKDGTGEKGPALTTMLTMTGKNLVLFRLLENEKGAVLGVSKKIDDGACRERLKKTAWEIPDGYGILLRTASGESSESEIKEEMLRMIGSLSQIADKGRYARAPYLLYGGGSLLSRTLQEILSDEVEEIITDSREAYEEAREAVKIYFEPVGQVKSVERVEPAEQVRPGITFYDGSIPLFRQHGLETQIEKALQKKVWLRSGGFITIEQTEACVVIDVNTGKFGGYKNHEKSVLKINREAAVEIARQLRLRNLSGIVIIDFIKMKSEDENDEIFDLLSREVKKDRLSVIPAGMTKLGLMELTRKKTREPLAAVMYNLSGGNGIGTGQ